jgi:uncharacterized protein YciI
LAKEKTMLFSIFAIDKPGAAETRNAVHSDHLKHLTAAAEYGVTIVTGGPLVSDDGAASIGSMMVVEAPDRASVEAFNRADPLRTGGVWGTVEIRRFDRKQ